jgi:ankyrin repeat protein
MRRAGLICFLLMVALTQYAWTNDKAAVVEESELQNAAAKAITLIQRSQAVWSTREVCSSCHHQLLPEIPLKLARERGIPVDEGVAQKTGTIGFGPLKDLDSAVQGYEDIDIFFDALTLTSASVAGVRPSLSTAAYAQHIASLQLEDGSWRTVDDRPPQAYSRFSATAVSARAIQQYLPEQLAAEKQNRLQRTRGWLGREQPLNTEDRAFQLFGLLWSGADGPVRNTAARRLIAEQQKDGGWSQLPGMESDAYSTGEALVALREAGGILTSDPVYQRGLRFLLGTQRADGSWYVKSRLHPPAPVSPPYFETGFPYEHDQFISVMGTTWAASALLHAMRTGQATAAQRPGLDTDPGENADWIRVALTGSVTELKKLLDGGVSPKARTAAGTTALMLAARDFEKVKLLVSSGADVNARAQTGFTALMVAARYRGNDEVIRFLLKSGAKPNAEEGTEVRYDASALFYAVMSGDRQMVRTLAEGGARVDRKMKLLGRFGLSPIGYAVVGGDSAMVEYLISKGASPNELDDEQMSLLAWAAINGRVSTAEVLLSRGADANHKDKYGMTPLLYAASIDYGDTAMIDKLIGRGADVKAKTQKGLTALDLARAYNHSRIASSLAARGGGR